MGMERGTLRSVTWASAYGVAIGLAFGVHGWVAGVITLAFTVVASLTVLVSDFRQSRKPCAAQETRSDLARALVRSAVVLGALALVAASRFLPHRAQAVLAVPVAYGCAAAAINAAYCFLCVLLCRDRLVSAVSFAVCLLGGTAAVLLLPLI
jgi:hypothetical protein